MKIILKALLLLLSLQASTILSMNAPDGWKINRPSGSGRPPRPRPQAVYGATPLAADTQTPPLAPTITPGADDAALAFFLNPINAPTATTPVAAPVYGQFATINPMYRINTQTPAQPQVTNPMHIINTQTPATPAAASNSAAQQTAMTPKERERLDKIKKKLDKIEKLLKEMGIDLAMTAISAVSLDPITVAFTGAGALINIPKLAYYYGNMQKHIFFLSSSETSTEAKERLKLLTPRLQKVSRVIAKGPESLQKLIKKFSTEEPKEAK